MRLKIKKLSNEKKLLLVKDKHKAVDKIGKMFVLKKNKLTSCVKISFKKTRKWYLQKAIKKNIF